MPFDIATLAAAYRDGLSPLAVIEAVYERIAAGGDNPVWITLTPEEIGRAHV